MQNNESKLWLHRLFNTDNFDTWLIVSYLYRYTSPGIHFYLTKKLRYKTREEINEVLPHLVHICETFNSKPLYNFLCEQSIECYFLVRDKKDMCDEILMKHKKKSKRVQSNVRLNQVSADTNHNMRHGSIVHEVGACIKNEMMHGPNTRSLSDNSQPHNQPTMNVSDVPKLSSYNSTKDNNALYFTKINHFTKLSYKTFPCPRITNLEKTQINLQGILLHITKMISVIFDQTLSENLSNYEQNFKKCKSKQTKQTYKTTVFSGDLFKNPNHILPSIYFADELVNISMRLKFLPKNIRQKGLDIEIGMLNYNLPGNAFSVLNKTKRVCSIVSDFSYVLDSAENSPFFVVLELCDFGDLSEEDLGDVNLKGGKIEKDLDNLYIKDNTTNEEPDNKSISNVSEVQNIVIEGNNECDTNNLNAMTALNTNDKEVNMSEESVQGVTSGQCTKLCNTDTKENNDTIESKHSVTYPCRESDHGSNIHKDASNERCQFDHGNSNCKDAGNELCDMTSEPEDAVSEPCEKMSDHEDGASNPSDNVSGHKKAVCYSGEPKDAVTDLCDKVNESEACIELCTKYPKHPQYKSFDKTSGSQNCLSSEYKESDSELCNQSQISLPDHLNYQNNVIDLPKSSKTKQLKLKYNNAVIIDLNTEKHLSIGYKNTNDDFSLIYKNGAYLLHQLYDLQKSTSSHNSELNSIKENIINKIESIKTEKRNYENISWNEKIKIVKEKSVYKNCKGYEIVSAIIKRGSDLRLEVLAMQLLNEMQRIFKEENLNVFIKCYKIILIDNKSAYIEAVNDVESIHNLKKRDKSLKEYFKKAHKEENDYKNAIYKFTISLVGYSLATYFLQIKDRHNGNILIDKEGYMIHVDYGFVLGNHPGFYNVERAPFKFSTDYLEVVDETLFKSLFLEGFMTLRKNSDRLCRILEILVEKNKIKNITLSTLSLFRDRFKMDLGDKEIEKWVSNLIDWSLNSIGTGLYDSYQYFSNGYMK